MVKKVMFQDMIGNKPFNTWHRDFGDFYCFTDEDAYLYIPGILTPDGRPRLVALLELKYTLASLYRDTNPIGLDQARIFQMVGDALSTHEHYKIPFILILCEVENLHSIENQKIRKLLVIDMTIGERKGVLMTPEEYEQFEKKLYDNVFQSLFGMSFVGRIEKFKKDNPSKIP